MTVLWSPVLVEELASIKHGHVFVTAQLVNWDHTVRCAQTGSHLTQVYAVSDEALTTKLQFLFKLSFHQLIVYVYIAL